MVQIDAWDLSTAHQQINNQHQQHHQQHHQQQQHESCTIAQ
jgi:hypothetical protein